MIRQLLAPVFLILTLTLGILMNGCETSQQESQAGEITLDSAIALAKYVQKTIAGDSCIGLYLNAIRLARKQENFGRQIYLHDKLADSYIYLNQYDIGKKHLDSALSIAEIHDTHYEAIGMSLASLGGYYVDMREFDKGLYYMEKALDYRLKNLGKDHEDIGNSFFTLGYFYLSTRREFDKSIEYNEKALELRIKSYGKESIEAAECYNNLALAYSETDDIEKALKIQKKASNIFEKKLPKNGYGVLLGYLNIGKYSLKLNQHKEAITWFEKINQTEKNTENEFLKISANISLGDAYLSIDSDKAKTLYNNTLRELSNKYGNKHPINISVYKKLSNYYKEVGMFDSTIFYLDLAEEITAEIFSKHSLLYADIASIYAKIYIESKKYEKAIIKTDEAISAIKPINYSRSDNSNYQSKQDKNLNRVDLANAYFLKGRALSKLNTLQSLKSSFEYLIQAIEIIENIKRNYSKSSSTNYISNKTEIIFDVAIQVALKLSEKTNDNYYKNYAFTIAEKSRAFNLISEINNANAKKFSGIPIEVYQKDDQFKRDISFYSELVYKYSLNKNISKEELDNVKSNLIEKERQYDSFIKDLEAEYPKYHQLNNEIHNISVEQVQNSLSANESLIEYFIGESHLTAFVITRNTFDIINQFKNKEFELKIIDLYNAINKFEKGKVKKLSKEVYQLIAAQVIKILPKNTVKLKIVPHKELAYLPFDCLIDIKQNYLIKGFTTSYYYSASLIKPTIKKLDSPSKNVLLFAPIYDNQLAMGLPPLAKSESEAKAINTLFQKSGRQTKIALREEASKVNFENSIEKFDIVHLATHTFINKEAINFSEINFWPDQENTSESTLTLSETFNLNLNTQLLTLSSCESGVGELIKGEGMMSFTRGFSYSGAQNIVCSMWKVNDLFTSETMIEMYKNINEGMSYDDALRQAKLKLIKKNPDLSPKDWAGFILISNN